MFFFARKLIPPTIGSTRVGFVPSLSQRRAARCRRTPSGRVGSFGSVWVGSGRVRLGQVGSGRVRLGQFELGRVRSGQVGLGWVGSVRVGGEEESGGDRGENENIKRGNDEVQAGGGDAEW